VQLAFQVRFLHSNLQCQSVDFSDFTGVNPVIDSEDSECELSAALASWLVLKVLDPSPGIHCMASQSSFKLLDTSLRLM
jgi:hypothetical protein